MGQSKTGGYQQLPTLSPEQTTVLQQLLSQVGGNQQAAAQGYKQFLPGGGGGQAITNAANQNFQQKTLPSILNAFGSGSKGGSGLNQALAAGAANLNTDLGAMLAQMQLGASQGLSGLAGQQAGLGVGTPQFAYTPERNPWWQRSLSGGLKGAGTGALLGSAVPVIGTGLGAAAGGALGLASGLFD